MLFAPQAQASPSAGGTLALAGQAAQLPAQALGAIEAQTGSPTPNTGAIVAAALEVAQRVSPAGGSAPAPTPSEGAGGNPPPAGGGTSAPGPPVPPESVTPPQPEGGAPAQGAPYPSAGAGMSDPNAAATQPALRQAPAGALATVAAVKPLAAAQRAGAKEPASASDRQRQAQAVVRLWRFSSWRERVQLSAFVPAVQQFIAQFRSLARDISASNAAAAPSKVAGAAAQELALVLTTANAPLASGSGQEPVAPRHVWPGATLGALSERQLSALAAAARLAGVAPRDMQKTSVATPTATTPTVASWLPSAAGAAFGSGITGAAVPAAALLAVFAVCLLGTWLPRRLADDGPACKSALLNLRLERPG